MPLLATCRATLARARSSASVSSTAAAAVGRSLSTVSTPAIARCTTTSVCSGTAGVASVVARTRISHTDSPACMVRVSVVS